MTQKYFYNLLTIDLAVTLYGSKFFPLRGLVVTAKAGGACACPVVMPGETVDMVEDGGC